MRNSTRNAGFVVLLFILMQLATKSEAMFQENLANVTAEGNREEKCRSFSSSYFSNHTSM